MTNTPTTTITLGGQAFTVGPLTLSQMRQVGIGGAKIRHGGETVDAKGKKGYDPVAAESAWYDGTFDIISVAIGKSRAELEAMQGVTFDELFKANNAIFEVSGLVTKATQQQQGGGGKSTEGEAGSGESSPA